MAGANWGIGIGAFANGIGEGIELGEKIKKVRQEREIEKLTKQGMKDAEAKRQESISGSISTVGDVPVVDLEGNAGAQQQPAETGMRKTAAAGEPAPAPQTLRATPEQIAAAKRENLPATPEQIASAKPQGVSAASDGIGGTSPEKPAAASPAAAGIEGPPRPRAWTVDGKEYGSAAEARKAAEANAAPVMDFFMREAAPKIRDAYIAQGKIEQAEKFASWIEDSNTKTGMRHWSRAVSAAQMGDYDAAARNLVKAYNTTGYFDDGYQAGKAEVIKGEDGNATGFRVTLKGKDGKEHTQEFKGTEDMLAVGLGMLSPQARFKSIYEESLAAKKAKLEDANEQGKEARKEAADQRKMKFQAETQARLEKYKSELRRAEESHRANVRGKAGSGDYRPSKSDEDLAADVYSALKDDYQFKKMTPDEKKQAIADEVRAIRESVAGGDTEAPLLDFGD